MSCRTDVAQMGADGMSDLPFFLTCGLFKSEHQQHRGVTDTDHVETGGEVGTKQQVLLTS